jgi:hypothetical protein
MLQSQSDMMTVAVGFEPTETAFLNDTPSRSDGLEASPERVQPPLRDAGRTETSATVGSKPTATVNGRSATRHAFGICGKNAVISLGRAGLVRLDTGVCRGGGVDLHKRVIDHVSAQIFIIRDIRCGRHGSAKLQ